MKIAIFGGSFNPVHNEHVNIVKAAKQALSLDKVIVMPTHVTPFKIGRLGSTTYDRLKMCELAFGGIDGVEVSDYEMKKGGVSYSYETCREFAKKYPGDKLYFILGADMLKSFPRWKHPLKILECVTLSVCARENEESLKEAEEAFYAVFGFEVEKFGYTGKKVSSTEIRALASLGEDISGYVPEKVADYIAERSLYLLHESEEVKSMLKYERWQHTVRVAVMAAENCVRAGVPELTALRAALLHDCAKYLINGSPYLNGFVCPESVPEPVIHQFAGAYIAEKTFGVKDENVLNAVKYHTSGRENMSPSEKLLYLCDMLEEGRQFDGVQKLREIFSRSIDEALYAAMEHQINYLNGTGKQIYSLTQRAFEYLKDERDDKSGKN